MIDRIILSRYARAFMAVVLERGLLDSIEARLQELDNVFRGNPSFLLAMRNPLIGRQDKKDIISGSIGDSIQPTLRDFLFLLVDKRRGEIFPYLYEEFSRLADEERGVIKAEVESAYPLTREQSRGLAEKLSSLTGKKVTLKETLSPAIIGGLLITLGSRIIDAGVLSRLKKMEQCMLKAGLSR